MKYSLYIDRWQTWNDDHQWLIDQQLEEGNRILLCIRDVQPDEKNPLTSEQIHKNLSKIHYKLIKQGKIRLMIIPDIDSFNYSTDSDYQVIQHTPPND